MGVLTSKDFEGKSSNIITERKRAERPLKEKPGFKKITAYRMNGAPGGVATIGIILNGEPKMLQIEDGIYRPKEKGAKLKDIERALKNSGLVDVSYLESEGKPKAVPKPEPKRRRLRHIEVEGDREYTVTVGEKELTLNVRKGFITTSKPDVIEALKERGFEVI